MTRCVRLGLAAAAAILAMTALLQGTPEYAKTEAKACEFCHTAVGKADLNDAGKYYKDHRTLQGYSPKKKN